eukprot:TRINITY_DN23386_c0_g1_i1.p1 TRINITY_DN23386_c0_g1~~TRINITY_DN23386_c0_g1_i1.p1  ORF type:complete len:670 (+),score=83.44 TRINITY_DN23386_c0_g1_i1:85-2094(+)
MGSRSRQDGFAPLSLPLPRRISAETTQAEPPHSGECSPCHSPLRRRRVSTMSADAAGESGSVLESSSAQEAPRLESRTHAASASTSYQPVMPADDLDRPESSGDESPRHRRIMRRLVRADLLEDESSGDASPTRRRISARRRQEHLPDLLGSASDPFGLDGHGFEYITHETRNGEAFVGYRLLGNPLVLHSLVDGSPLVSLHLGVPNSDKETCINKSPNGDFFFANVSEDSPIVFTLTNLTIEDVVMFDVGGTRRIAEETNSNTDGAEETLFWRGSHRNDSRLNWSNVLFPMQPTRCLGDHRHYMRTRELRRSVVPRMKGEGSASGNGFSIPLHVYPRLRDGGRSSYKFSRTAWSCPDTIIVVGAPVLLGDDLDLPSGTIPRFGDGPVVRASDADGGEPQESAARNVHIGTDRASGVMARARAAGVEGRGRRASFGRVAQPFEDLGRVDGGGTRRRNERDAGIGTDAARSSVTRSSHRTRVVPTPVSELLGIPDEVFARVFSGNGGVDTDLLAELPQDIQGEVFESLLNLQKHAGWANIMSCLRNTATQVAEAAKFDFGCYSTSTLTLCSKRPSVERRPQGFNKRQQRLDVETAISVLVVGRVEFLRERVESVYDTGECVICLASDSPTDVVLYSCGHRCAHRSCLQEARLRRCPLCRSQIMATLPCAT